MKGGQAGIHVWLQVKEDRQPLSRDMGKEEGEKGQTSHNHTDK